MSAITETRAGTINIAGLDKAEVLAALYNAAKAQGMGLLHYTPEPMTIEQARELLGSRPDLAPHASPRQRTYFDYVKGRVMKVELSGDELNTRLYDRDNGDGAAERALKPLLDARS